LDAAGRASAAAIILGRVCGREASGQHSIGVTEARICKAAILKITAADVQQSARRIWRAGCASISAARRRQNGAASSSSGSGARRGAIDDATIHDSVHTTIVEHIVMPGTKLAGDVLAKAFRVSRTRIRKVLLALAHENLVTLQHSRGASVAKSSVQEARDRRMAIKLSGELHLELARLLGNEPRTLFLRRSSRAPR